MGIIKISDNYAIETGDRLNLWLLKLELQPDLDTNGKIIKVPKIENGNTVKNKTGQEVMINSYVQQRHEWNRIGSYGNSFSSLVKRLIQQEINSVDVETIKELDVYIRGHIVSLNYDKMIRKIQDDIQMLENKNKELVKINEKLNNQLTKYKLRGDI